MTITTPTELPVAPTVQRLTWLAELMGRFASERTQGTESARIAAAIVIHLRALKADLAESQGLASIAELWLENWEHVLDRAISRATVTHTDRAASAVSLHTLVAQARAF